MQPPPPSHPPLPPRRMDPPPLDLSGLSVSGASDDDGAGGVPRSARRSTRGRSQPFFIGVAGEREKESDWEGAPPNHWEEAGRN